MAAAAAAAAIAAEPAADTIAAAKQPSLVAVCGGQPTLLPREAAVRLELKSISGLSAAAGDSFVVCTRDGGYDLHVRSASVSICKGGGGSWVRLAEGAQRPLNDGTLLELDEGGSQVRWRCDFPHSRREAPKPSRGQRQQQQQARTAASSDGTARSAAASAAELEQIALRRGELHAELTAGFRGPERQAAARKLQAAGDGLTKFPLPGISIHLHSLFTH